MRQHTNSWPEIRHILNAEKIRLCKQLVNCDDRVLGIGAQEDDYTLLLCDLVSPDGIVTTETPDPDNLGDDLALAPLDFIHMGLAGNASAITRLTKTISQSPHVKILCEFAPLSLWLAGYSPVTFLNHLAAQGLRAIARDQQGWRAINTHEVIQALESIPQVAITTLIDSLQHNDDQQAVYKQAQIFLNKHHYPRPALENMLFVAPDAWKTVCQTLGISDEPHTTAEALTADTNKKRWHCRWASKHDQDALLTLFQSAFGHAMPEALWAWKYANRSQIGVLAHREGRVVAYYGGLPRTLWIDGTQQQGVQICDVMVAPEERGVLSRRGAFMQTTIAFLKSSVGADRTYQYAFGFPSGRHAKLGEKSGFYTPAAPLLEAEWPAVKFLMARFKLRMTELTRDDKDSINTLWHTMQPALADHLLPQKDADFLIWRYLKHPTQNYIARMVSSRWGNRMLGIFVLRDHGPEQGVELIDLLGAPKHLNQLLRCAQNLVVSMNRKRLFGWLTDAVLTWLPAPAASSKVIDIYLYNGTPDTGKLVERLQSKVWLMGGDTDFK